MFESLLLAERPRASRWAEENLVFPRGTSPNAPGRLSFDRTPYLREILDNYLDENVETVVVCGASQCGKSALLISGFGVLLDQMPNNGIWSMTSDAQMRRFSRNRLMPFIKANPCLRRHIKDATGTMQPLSYELDNMDVKLTGVGSPAQLASETCAWVVADEAAKYPWLRKEEAPPLELLRERTKGFPRRFHIFTSTPTTIENDFWQEFLSGDMRQYFVPCPYCSKMITFEFNARQMIWEKPDEGFSNIDLAERSARFVCPECGGEIWDEMKGEMMQKGEWRPSEKLRLEYGAERVEPSRKVRSYQINSMYSPFVTFGQIVRTYLESLQKTNVATALQNFHNSWLALPYEFTKVTVKKKHISALCGTHHRKELPEDFYYLSVGYDPGGDATHWVAVALCPGGDIWVVDWGTILAFRSQTHAENVGTETSAVWQTVVDKEGIAPHFSGLRYAGKDGEMKRVSIGYVDAGYSTADVYAECMMVPQRLQPTKGSPAKTGDFWMRPAGPTWPGLNVITYVDYQLKMSLYSETIARGRRPRLILPRAEDCEEELFQGLSGQKLVQKANGLEWRKVANDHYGDCIKLAGRLSWWVLHGMFEDRDELHDAEAEAAAAAKAGRDEAGGA
ncbi:MAG: phage terminase large subunit family protein [Akkermansia sp.]|nr:phage terminase large subunit family protein [Akkermansia sp.]